ncbi:MAG: 3-deoxy-manno-octulosonate-8-phosphatase KdsC [Sedimenticola sp.]|uniref:3-deoxy-D-manno-octulosonate 8-phosphate phosphatase KdsC n=1 Tax=Sedimenticola thiotaurini TaxID=1543721 RepID=A0A558DCA5_9GAMM|nr:3-deoxy-manno-octulosonate-8-phosphatase KdsC [Sedimenticola sp.]TVT58608.1 MAG: 3-deoxy-manno-octulosonate-8-phosphatase KdsC [Sedimenticola thiotaurini]MCW8947000.1 3-deoxy-manno-octulosonate-8-phosphatase KdsC [Sedimenticola sp.]MCW8950400.1 3-deoxy-manno-octulosonate-8-phosphatase KdsC [Sedimenticola sp.]MCW8974885.1 3-deoxy-manno-octulosonate-8-phosphatase KdsC [Sedimenticola sp.]
MEEILKRAQQIELIIFDVDGVLTDSTLYLGDDGQEYKAFNSKDGLGMKLLQKSGVEIGIITGRTSNVVTIRMESLGIRHVYQGQRNKIPAFESLRDELGLSNEQIAFVGDDVVDLPVMRQVGLAITVQDAHYLVKQQAHWQTQQPGGHGAAREVCELILQAQGKLESAFAKFLQ